MAFTSGFRGTVGGSVQSNYTDQPGRAVAGMMAFASEEAIALLDSMIIMETNGIAAGRGVKFTQLTEAGYNLQVPNAGAYLPATGDDVADFAGILVFDETMQSDENGVPGYAKGRVGRILRKGRSGGRVWIKVQETVAVTDTLYLVTVKSTDEAFQPGDFAVSTPTGATVTDISTVAKIITPATGTTAAPALCLIELI